MAVFREQDYSALPQSIMDLLVQDANDGVFNMGNLVTDGYSIQYPIMTVDCPPGTLYNASVKSGSYSCGE